MCPSVECRPAAVKVVVKVDLSHWRYPNAICSLCNWPIQVAKAGKTNAKEMYCTYQIWSPSALTPFLEAYKSNLCKRIALQSNVIVIISRPVNILVGCNQMRSFCNLGLSSLHRWLLGLNNCPVKLLHLDVPICKTSIYGNIMLFSYSQTLIIFCF